MELKELIVTSFHFKINQPFALSSSQNGHFSVITNDKAFVLQPNFNTQDYFNHRTMSVSVPEIFPAKILQKDDKQLFEAASRNLMREFLLDASLGLGNTTIRPVRIEWSPAGLVENSNDALLLCRTNVGGCKVLAQNIGSAFNYAVANLNELCTKEVLVNVEWPVISVEQLKEIVKRISIQEMCWNNLVWHGCGHIATVTATGRLYILRLQKASSVDTITHSLDFSCDINVECINLMKWHSFKVDNEIQSFLLLESLGRIVLYSVDFEMESVVSITECSVLFSHQDKIGATAAEFEIHSKYIIIVITKGSFVLGFKVDYEGQLIATWNKYIQAYGISGFLKQKSGSYLISTLGYQMIYIKIATDKNGVKSFKEEAVHDGDPSSKYHCYGIAASVNQAYFLSLKFPSVQFDHLSMRNPTNLYIYRKSKDTGFIDNLTNNPHKKLTNYYDCLEVIRYELQQRNGNVNDMLSDHFILPDTINIDRDFMYNLKTQLAVHEVGLFPTAPNLKRLVIAVNIFLNLSKLLNILTDATIISDFQIKSIYCMHKVLLNYMQLVNFDEHNFLRTSLESSIAEMEQAIAVIILEPIKEECLLCDEELNDTELGCPNGHNLRRCIFSCTQLPLMNAKCCSQCNANVLDDDNMLKHLFLDDQMFCPICDSYFKTNFYF